MGESKQQAIERLLREGLNHYGLGQVEQAIHCWREVLSLEPDQTQALEYLDTCGQESQQAQPGRDPGADAIQELLEAGIERLRADDPETALELFETVAARDPDRLEVHGYVDRVRSELLKRYRERMGSGGAVPRLQIQSIDVMKYNLPADAGFLLSLIDGQTRVDDVISVCAMDEFRTLQILSQMLDAGILEVSS